MAKNKYLIFIIQAFVEQRPDSSVSDVTTIELIEESADKALERAKSIIAKPFYRISNVIERYENT